MTLYQKARNVEKLFAQLDREIQKFSENTGMTCLSGCGFCCSKPNAEATVLEFLPFAMQAYLHGTAEAAWEMLSGRSEKLCHLFQFTPEAPHSGHCSSYAQRGLTCRLFGYSARVARDERLQLYTCNIFKTQKPEEYAAAVAFIQKRKQVPQVSDFYRKLRNIDAELGSSMYPINEAQKKALELVLHYYSYRKPPRTKKAA